MNESYQLYCLSCLLNSRYSEQKPKKRCHLPYGENCKDCGWTQNRQCCVICNNNASTCSYAICNMCLYHIPDSERHIYSQTKTI